VNLRKDHYHTIQTLQTREPMADVMCRYTVHMMTTVKPNKKPVPAAVIICAKAREVAEAGATPNTK